MSLSESIDYMSKHRNVYQTTKAINKSKFCQLDDSLTSNFVEVSFIYKLLDS